jgi:hypothetical protein
MRPRQGALAGRQRAGGLVEREALVQPLPCPGLEAFDQRIAVREMVGDGIGRLRGARIHDR